MQIITLISLVLTEHKNILQYLLSLTLEFACEYQS